MVKVKKELVKKRNEVQARERYPAATIERHEDDYVYGIVKDIWFYEDKRFPGQKRLGMTIDVIDGMGEVWDADAGQAVHEKLEGTHTFFFRHSYVLKAFEDKAPAEVIGQPVIIYNLGKGDRGYLYRIIIGDAVREFVEE